ncbi:MAG: CvpA family protein [Oscillospiraceae bacterium]|jgi:hypothetical protein|nr:CvpA family protein [Oscillospiraceae bacterium]
MEPIKVDFTKKGKSGVKDLLIPPEKAGLKIVINIILTLVVAAVLYYFMLPPMNFKAREFYMYFAIVFASYVGSAILTTRVMTKPEYIPYVKKQATVPIILIVVLGVIFGVGFLSSATIFRAKAYSRIIQVDEGADFESSVSAIKNLNDFEKVPKIDDRVAEMLADKSFGDLAALGYVSQFDLAAEYSTQINYQNRPYRVFPLQYAGFFKWFYNRDTGHPGYITVDMHTSEARFVDKNENGDPVTVKYSPSELFGRYLMRVLRFEYPTYMFGVPSFEIDDAGNPFWIVEHIDKTVGLLGGDDIAGVVMVNAVTGESTYYTIEEMRANQSHSGENLSWIDQVYSADLLIQQYNYKGRYSNGFINYYIGQEGVKATSDGWSYLAINDDVYICTGITSVTAENSVIGFLLVNQRTKEASIYEVIGASEKAAQDSAKGIVSDKNWNATFPLLLNLGGEPTYFMALTDQNAGVVKGYSMVNVRQFDQVVRSPDDNESSYIACLQEYIKKFPNVQVSLDGASEEEQPGNIQIKKSGVIADIRDVVINSNSVFFIRLEGSNTVYMVTAAKNNAVVMLNKGDTVNLVMSTDKGDHIAADIDASPEETPETQGGETTTVQDATGAAA